MFRTPARPHPLVVVALLAFALGLTACSGSSDLITDVIDAATQAGSQDETGNAVPGELRVENDSDYAVCRLMLSDFEDPDAAPVDLVAEHSGEPLAPGDVRVYPQGEHPLMDDHNLLVTAEGCDGEAFEGYAFAFIQHGGVYSVRHRIDS